MNRITGKQIVLWGASFLLLILLAACSHSANESQQEPEGAYSADKGTISYTTITGEETVIPAQPQRVIYLGTAIGDLLAMNIPVVGTNIIHNEGSYLAEKLKGIVDVGNPGDLEAIMALQPDLILNGYTQDPDRNAAFAKIAPTIPFNSALPFKDRVRELGKIFSKQDEAEQWITHFDAKSQVLWDKLQLEEGETATIYLQLGKQLYVMGNRSLGVILYQEQGFAIPPAIEQNIISIGHTFVELSEEVLPEYAGDHLFILVLDDDKSQQEVDRLLKSQLWATLPAVQQGHVYTASADWNTDNLLALDQLLEELPKWMNRQ
jgi:iron complex transport system substrate-binding protein